MASTTFTLTPYLRNFDQKTVHTGLNVVYAEKTVTFGTSDRVLAAKLPHGARVIDGWVLHTTGNEIGVGTSASENAFISTASAAGHSRFFQGAVLDGAGYKVSVSDDAVQRWVPVKIKAFSASAGGSPLKFCIMYLMDGD